MMKTKVTVVENRKLTRSVTATTNGAKIMKKKKIHEYRTTGDTVYYVNQ